MSAASLTIDVGSNVSDAVGGLGDVGDIAKSAAGELADLGAASTDSAAKIGQTSSAAKEFGSNAGKTTGVLKALSKGFALVGLDGVADKLNLASQATTFFKGAGKGLNLVMETQTGKFIASKAAMVGSTIASGASAAATGVMTAAQWALNAAMSANPIGLIVLAVAALAVGFLVLYKKSDTFRGIIQDIGRVGRAAIGLVVGAVSSLISWFGTRFPNAAGIAKTLVVGYLKLITLPIRTVINVVISLISYVRDKLPGAFDAAKTAAGRIGDALLAPFRAVKNAVQDIIDLIKRIKVPSLPDLNPFNGRLSAGRVAGSVSAATLVTTGAGDVSYGPTYNENLTVNFYGPTDPNAAADEIERMLIRRARQFGAAA